MVTQELLNYHRLGVPFMHIETNDSNSVDENVLVSFEKAEIFQISFLISFIIDFQLQEQKSLLVDLEMK